MTSSNKSPPTPTIPQLPADLGYLGHDIDMRITAEGLQPTPVKTQAIVSAPAPLNVSHLKSFLGLVNYYAKFLPNLSNTLAPLYALLQKQVEWSWGRSHEEAINSAKQLLSSSRVLAHFDPAKELLLACDASPYGVGEFSRKCWTMGLTGQWHSLRDLLPLLKSATPSLTRKAWQ